METTYQSVSSLASSRYMRVLKNIINGKLEENQPPVQAAYGRGYSTMGHLQTINQVQEKCHKYEIPLFMAFADSEKAFDPIGHCAVMKALQRHGVPQKYMNTLTNVYTYGSAQIRKDKLSASIKIEKGLRQGDRLSSILFTVALENIFKRTELDLTGIKIKGEQLFLVEIVQLAENNEELSRMLEELNREGKKNGMNKNMKKTKVMCNAQRMKC